MKWVKLFFTIPLALIAFVLCLIQAFAVWVYCWNWPNKFLDWYLK